MTDTFDLGTDDLVIDGLAEFCASFDSRGSSTSLGHRLGQVERDIYLETVVATGLNPLGVT